MADLVDRLMGLESDGTAATTKIPIHGFASMMDEKEDGVSSITGAYLTTLWTLDAGQVTQLQTIFTRYTSNALNRTRVKATLYNGELGYYTKAQVVSRLGL